MGVVGSGTGQTEESNSPLDLVQEKFGLVRGLRSLKMGLKILIVATRL